MKTCSDNRTHHDRGMRGNLRCPHCRAPLRTRSSLAVSETYRTLNLACFNVECGATFGAELTITHAISPSARPNPAVVLRTAPPRRRVPANDGQPKRLTGPEVPALPANDDQPTSAALG